MSATNGIADGTNGITLLPCPVCGCIEAVRETLYLTDIPVLCCGEGCGFSVFLYKDSSWDELERVWNTRWHPKPTDAVREFAERYERRIAELELLVRDMWPFVWHSPVSVGEFESIGERIRELGIEV